MLHSKALKQGQKDPKQKENRRRHHTEQRKGGSKEPKKGTMTEGKGWGRICAEKMNKRTNATEAEDVNDGHAT